MIETLSAGDIHKGAASVAGVHRSRERSVEAQISPLQEQGDFSSTNVGHGLYMVQHLINFICRITADVTHAGEV